jgi:hypothetical protein
MSEQPIQPPAPAPVNADVPGRTDDIDARIARLVNDRVAKLESAYDKKIRALELRHRQEMKAARGTPPPGHFVVANGGGPGGEFHETWSQYHQELANAGKLTEDHIRQTQGLEPIEYGDVEDDDDVAVPSA